MEASTGMVFAGNVGSVLRNIELNFFSDNFYEIVAMLTITSLVGFLLYYRNQLFPPQRNENGVSEERRTVSDGNDEVGNLVGQPEFSVGSIESSKINTLPVITKDMVRNDSLDDVNVAESILEDRLLNVYDDQRLSNSSTPEPTLTPSESFIDVNVSTFPQTEIYTMNSPLLINFPAVTDESGSYNVQRKNSTISISWLSEASDDEYLSDDSKSTSCSTEKLSGESIIEAIKIIPTTCNHGNNPTYMDEELIKGMLIFLI